jgi:predicted AlkP superfamily phosphohydrolase/phosphomutase
MPGTLHGPLGRATLLTGAFLLLAPPAHAYIGPGAGFALLSSFLVVFTTIVLVFVSLLIWPVRMTFRLLRRGKRSKPWAKRLIVLGFDGQDPKLTDRLMGEGRLPNFKRLAEMGCYHRLQTTYPSISPVAWSSFSTGTQPPKHSIYDFLDRDRRSYLPLLSSAHIGEVRRFLKLGRWRIPLQRPELRLLRKSKPFWSLLGEHQVWSTVLRVPITFPPEKFHGAQLSAMCAPDLLGSQGTFLLYTTRPATDRFKEGGLRVALDGSSDGSRFATSLKGPENMFVEGTPPLELPMSIDLDRTAQRARVTLDGRSLELEPGRLSDWTPFAFRAAPGIKVAGICRMMAIEIGEHFSLYVTPLNIDPDRPAMPISHPSYYATYLSRRIGPYATLGLAEDTWALNEGVIDDATFLKLAYDIDREREKMFFLSLDRLRTGTLTCVFDATDRIQHMFWRYIEPGHPAARGRDGGEHKGAIEAVYRHNDELVGRVLERLQPGDVLMVVSDHGFTSFRRGCNLNAWLHQNGYLALKPGASGSEEWLQGVDWARTRAYALGLSGLFLNVKGREAQGVVEPGEEAARLKAELIAKLSGLRDDEKGSVAIREAFDSWKLYQGPYLGNAPDLIIGYDEGYRVSWDGATGVVATPVFEDNVKAWSGDHCVDPRLVPGVFFCNYPVDRASPRLLDIAPTALRIFGVERPGHMEGEPLFADNPLARRPAASRAA